MKFKEYAGGRLIIHMATYLYKAVPHVAEKKQMSHVQPIINSVPKYNTSYEITGGVIDFLLTSSELFRNKYIL